MKKPAKQGKKKCEHIWVLFEQNNPKQWAVCFKFYCQKCLIFRYFQEKDIKFEE